MMSGAFDNTSGVKQHLTSTKEERSHNAADTELASCSNPHTKGRRRTEKSAKKGGEGKRD